MKLIIQIPCLNEETTLPQTLEDLPRSIPGIDAIEMLVIDDGSSDRTAEVAKECGVHHIVRHKETFGLAQAFRTGMDYCLKADADIIVNLDGDNQYKGSDIEKLLAPILEGKADMVIGNRPIREIEHFSSLKKFLQRVGSFVVRRLSRTDVSDTTSGFRAINRRAALKMNILSNYTYTLESIMQVRVKDIVIANVPITTNAPTRESRLIRGTWSYLVFSVATIIRIFTMYNPLRVFVLMGLGFLAISGVIGARFLFDYLFEGGAGHVQSLVFAAIATVIGVSLILIGVLADLIQFNRRLLEEVLERVRKLELRDSSD